MTLAVGTRLGPYEIQSPIGAGGMGEVYRARATKLDRSVALKILPESFAHDPERLARFEREAKTLASLNHPNIGGIYGLESIRSHPRSTGQTAHSEPRLERRLLAGHGFPSLALGYFGLDGLRPDLIEIPIAYFRTAIEWFSSQPGVKPDVLGVAGRSRGAELALLLDRASPPSDPSSPTVRAASCGTDCAAVHPSMCRRGASRIVRFRSCR